MQEIVKINWRAIAISEWQSFDFAQRFNRVIVNTWDCT